MTSIAIVHDYLTQRGGAERLVLEMHRAFPGAPVYTTLFEPDSTFPEFADIDVRVTGLNRLGVLRADHRRALPVLAGAISQMKVEADVALCSSSGWAHGVRTTGSKLVYCHNPARWLYQPDDYLRESGRMVRAGLPLIAPALRRWDRRAALSADHYIVNSRVVAGRVRRVYGIEPSLVYPCRALEPHGADLKPSIEIEPGFILSVGRLLPYKNVDAVIGAVEQLGGMELVIVGGGPDEARLKESARGLPVHFVGQVCDESLRWFYRNCGVVASMAFEDFGLVPVEAAGFRRPVVALRCGGFLETVLEGQTGVFVDEPHPELIAEAVRIAVETTWDGQALADHGDQFSPGTFRRAVSTIVGEWS